ncbi:MAG: acyltransferase family protein [Prevotella histicola]|jgi:hypothetical protein|uniref:acyltransferase family protein n=1 Tax=Prevotella histicola TaxID=470565 RepID=UPI001CADD04A|nr:acyltransferase family protein [Prevotella histicola]MBF1392759.1 acyltransferase family protein [Prevotella histicola]
MTKQQTQFIKGIALLFMVWGHLFASPEITNKLQSLISIGGIPFESLICRGMGPVDFFLVVGGYGLFYLYRKSDDKYFFLRIFKLYIHYWIILIFFLPLVIIIGHKAIVFSCLQIFYEFTGLHASWDPPAWFLLPYSLLSLSHKKIFYLVDKINWKFAMPILYVLSFLMAVLLHLYGSTVINSNPLLSTPIVFVEFLFPFSFGAYACKYDIFAKLKDFIINRKIHTLYVVLSLIVLFAFRCFFNTSAGHSLYVILFICLFVMIPINNSKTNYLWIILEKIGKQSMGMWLIHFFIYAYLFDGVIYKLKSPMLIFVAVVSISYTCSLAINVLTNIIISKVRFLK